MQEKYCKGLPVCGGGKGSKGVSGRVGAEGLGIGKVEAVRDWEGVLERKARVLVRGRACDAQTLTACPGIVGNQSSPRLPKGLRK